jgi:hypothetical protein
MPIKNYTREVPAHRSIQEIQTALAKNGASAIAFEYEQGTGRVQALNFKLPFNGADVTFSLPVDWRRFQAVLEQQNVSGWRNEDYVYRVAWRCMRDWVLAQLAFYETRMVDIPQIFLPYALTRDGKTVYEQVEQHQFLLGNGNNNHDEN